MPMLVQSKDAHVVHAAAGLPVDEATRADLVDFGAKNLRAENGRQNVRGAFTKRNGFAALASARLDASVPTAAYKMFADRSSIIRITETLQAEAYSPKTGAWSVLGRVPEATARLIDTPSMGIAAASASLEDVDATNGFVALSWLSIALGGTASAFLSIIDQTTGSVIRAPEKIGTSTDLVASLLAVQGNYFIAARYNSTGTKIEAWYLDTTSAATLNAGWVAFAAPLCADASGSSYVLHTLPHASTPRVAILYGNTSAGTDRLTLLAFNVGGVVQTKTILTNSTVPNAIAIGGFATDTLWLAWNEVTTIAMRGVTPFTITVDRATVAYIGVMVTGCNYIGIAASTVAGKARWWATDTAAVLQSAMMSIKTVAGATTSDGAQVRIPAVKMIRKPFFTGGRYYGAFYGADAGNIQANFFVCDWSDDVNYLRPIANPSPGLASVGLLGQGKFVAGTSATTFLVGMGVKRSAIADGSALLEIDFANGKRWRTASHATSTFLSAGVPCYFDGLRVAEVGFLLRPAKPTATLAGTGITGTFLYVAVYEETDSDGNWHVSGVSDPSASIAPANQTVTLTTTPLTISSRVAPSGSSARSVRVAWYRTATGGLAPYYRLGTTLNDPTALTLTFADNIADATLTTNSKLYSQVGVIGTAQDRRPPPSFSSIVSYNGMLIGASGSNVWFSGQNVSGEGTWFNPIFQVPVPGDGDITALAVMDGALFVFKRREVYAVAGEPPSDSGSLGGLGVPRRLACDVGCIDARSICTTAHGIFFQSDRGIEILTRAQIVEWIGIDYQTTVLAFPVCTSITVEPVSCVVLVELAASEAAGLVTGLGCTLVFDLSLRTWVSKDTRTAASVLGVPSQAACMVYTGTAWLYAWVASSGVTYAATPSTSLDDGAVWITLLIETADAKHGLQQLQRIWAGVLLFEQRSAAGLKIEVAYDRAAYSVADDKVWAEGAVLAKRQLEWAPKSLGQAMRFRISDSAPAILGTGQGITFIGLSLSTAPKQGPTKGTPQFDPTAKR